MHTFSKLQHKFSGYIDISKLIRDIDELDWLTIDYLPEQRQCELFVVPHMTLTMPWPIHSFLHFCPEFLFL